MRHNTLPLAAIFLVSLCVFSLGRSRLVSLSAEGPAQSRYLTGDEPAYMLLAHSLVTDGDFNLYNNRVERDGRFFGKESCDEHGARRDLENRQIYSIHTPGLAILIAPAYALGLHGPVSPRAAVCVFMNVLAALLAVNIYLFCTEIAGSGGQSSWPALLATASVVLTPPVLFYSSLVYPELPAALLILYAFRHVMPTPSAIFKDSRNTYRSVGVSEYGCNCASSFSLNAVTPICPYAISPIRRLAVSLALASLPWLSIRFFLPAFILLVFMVRREGRRGSIVPVLLVFLSLILFCCYQLRAFGTINPWAAYTWQQFGARRGFFSKGVLDGILGLVLDRGHGILTWSPVYILSLTGLLLLLREQRAFAVCLVVLLVSIYLPAANFSIWWGGFAPPPRYMVVPAPLLGGALCYALSRSPKKSFLLLYGMLLAVSLIFGCLGLMHPSLLYRHRHIINNFPRLSWLTVFLPSFFRKGTSTWPLAALWGMIILLANLLFVVRWRKPGNYHSPHGAGPRA